ncbi:MAG: VOC family protein [Moritella sp.]|uniref:VOC family protein n=1 Tax=Moritella sp. TaxID=78556 RepID=UPI001DFEE228|nr:VOC family protein [Moritella sp.]NQZ51095.1 VOC family protein [Moritella sp.]
MPDTSGINHLGLAVLNLESSRAFFVELLGWSESGFDASYPRTAVSDGKLKLTLWQVDNSLQTESFDRRKNIGLHHLALEVETEEGLMSLHQKALQFKGVKVEFAPELIGNGPRKHMMCYEPGGIRIEFTWPGV